MPSTESVCLSRTNKPSVIRGATLHSWQSHALFEIRHAVHAYIPRQLTCAVYVAEYSAASIAAFDCTLRGPFDGLFPTRLSATRALCEGIIAFISASTVCYDVCIISP